MMENDIVQGGILGVLKAASGPYSRQVIAFVDYLERNHLTIADGIPAYLTDLKRQTKTNREGRQVSYSASWWNQRLKGVKWGIRYLLDHSPSLSVSQRWSIERELKKLKAQRPPIGIAKADRMPSAAEVATLEENADPRLALMIKFLAATGCRISEMLDAEIGKARRGDRITYIAVKGKSGERQLRIPTILYDSIREVFRGQTYLFEHGANRYSRVSVTSRIRQLAERTIGKATTAHLLRHYRGTLLSERYGISKAASELGHRNISVTKQFYDHSRLSDDEYLESLKQAK
jgi:integrase